MENKAKSGANFDTIEIEVLSTLQEGIQVLTVKEGEKIAGVGKTITIRVLLEHNKQYK